VGGSIHLKLPLGIFNPLTADDGDMTGAICMGSPTVVNDEMDQPGEQK